jgi:hypothetical protein
MTTHAQFYLTRAAVARELADGSQLDNVKESHLRAAEAWDGFAARAMKADLMRAEEVKRKSAEAETAHSDASALTEEATVGGELVDDSETRGMGGF